MSLQFFEVIGRRSRWSRVALALAKRHDAILASPALTNHDQPIFTLDDPLVVLKDDFVDGSRRTPCAATFLTLRSAARHTIVNSA